MKFERDKITSFIENRDDDALASFLMSGVHHGKPGVPQAVKVQVIATIKELTTPRQQLWWARSLMGREEAMARQVACGLVAADWERDRKGTLKRMRALAEDEDWGVREWAVEPMADVLGRDFDHVLEIYRDWIENGAEALRRAIALALSARARERLGEQAKPMLALLALLMPMPGAYLQKNLGPFVVGGGFLARFPRETLAFLRQQSRKKNENVRWNVAMAFTTAVAARHHVEAGEEILAHLASDERPRIVRAVARARRNLATSAR
jgi:hypothetical protein